MKRVIAFLLAAGLVFSQGTEVCLAEEVAGDTEGVLYTETTETEETVDVTEVTETEDAAETTEVSELTELKEAEILLDTETEELQEEEEIRKAGYTISGSEITVSVTNGEDIAKALDDALKEARDLATDAAPVTVKVPAGEYILSGNMHIYSNTTLDVTGVTLKNKGSHNMLMSGTNGKYAGYDNYNESEGCKGYDGFKNITIKGGTWISTSDNESTIIRLSHATNVTLDGVTVSGGGCAHQIEVAAINGFYVKGCTFKDFGKSSPDISDKQEALQLDIACSSDVFKGIYEDGTVMKNVEVTGCTFSNVPRGVGTHTMLNGAYHENIKINGNTFNNVIEEAIVGLNYYNCEIKDNKINECGAGILFQYFKADTKSVYTTIFDGTANYSGTIMHDAKTVISGNDIKTKYYATCDEIQGIKVYGVNLAKSSKGGDGKSVPAGNYYISGVTVTNNTITTAGHGIHMVNSVDCVVTDNKIVGKDYSSKDVNVGKYDGIFVTSGSKNVALTSNKISDLSRNGIFVQESAYISQITGNTITGNGRVGINFYSKSGCTGDISGNTISKCAGGGILVSTDSETANITNNELSGISGDAGITVYKNSKVGEISNNTITGMGKDDQKKYCHGIKLTTDSSSASITGNTVKTGSDKYSSANGILVYNGSKVEGSITGNVLEKTADTAMSVSTKSAVTGDISGNQILTTDNSGIFVYKSSSVGGDIRDNKVSSAKQSGIYITGKTTVKGGIISNKITSVGGKGIFVYDEKKDTTVVGNIEKNTIKKAKSQGINISSTKNNLKVIGNNISEGSDNVIIIQPNTTKYTITVENNTVKGNKKVNGIRVIKGKVSVANNKISNVIYGVYTDKGVKGDIYNNTFGSKVTTQVRVDTASGKQNTKKITINSVKSSAKAKATVKWKKLSGVSGYEVQYATDKKFSNVVKKDAKSKTSLNLTKLKSKKTYYVRVTGYNKVGDVKIHTNYGKVKTVKVK